MNARLHDRYAAGKILAAIEREHIDLVHLHNTHGNYMGIRDVREIAARCPVVWTLHDMWSFTGHCAYAGDCDHWRTRGCARCQNLSMFPRLYIDRAAAIRRQKRNISPGGGITFVTPSQWLYRLACQSFLGQEEIRMIHNGVNTVFSVRQQRGPAGKITASVPKTGSFVFWPMSFAM